MLTSRRPSSILLIGLMLLQLMAPIAMANGVQSTDIYVETDADLELLSMLNIAPRADSEHGWLTSDDATDTTHLLYRDVSLLSPTE